MQRRFAYLFFMVISSRLNADGEIEVDPPNVVRAMTRLTVENGATYEPLSENEVSSDMQEFVGFMTESMMLLQGQNPSVVIFHAFDQSGAALADPAMPGGITLQVGENKFSWQFPLGTPSQKQ